MSGDKLIFGHRPKQAYQKVLEGEMQSPKNGGPQGVISSALTGTAILDNPSNYIYVPHGNLYVAKQTIHLGKNWYEAHEALDQEGMSMLTLDGFVHFLEELGSNDAQDASGNFLSRDECKSIYDSITKKGDPWRAEWLDAKFETKNNALWINYHHSLHNGVLIPSDSSKLAPYAKEGYVDWPINSNTQGLPIKS